MKKYLSKYSNGKDVTPAQFIAEMACERIAKKKKRDLHYRFWLSPEWEKEYKGQIAAANKLLLKYSPKDIIDGLLTEAGRKIYSLRAPHLSGIIEKTSKNKIVSDKPKTIQRNLLDTGKKTNHSKNILDILKDIDNGSNSR